MTDAPSFTLPQAIEAQRSLRAALGLGEESFPLPAFIGMIGDEIELMRSAGRSDRELVEIVAKATGIEIDPADVARFHAPGERRHPDRHPDGL